MFRGCGNLKSINLEGLNAEYITRMNYMFYGCQNLLYLNIYNLDTRHITDFDYIFGRIEKKFIIEYDPKKTDISLQREINDVIWHHIWFMTSAFILCTYAYVLVYV